MSIRKNSKVRVRRQPEAAREHILAAAERVLVEAGPLALKLAEVAAAADVANATVLHHFGSIDGLHAALMERMVQQLVADVLAITNDGGEPGTHQEKVLHALFDVFENRNAARLAAWLELTGEARRLTHISDAVREVVTKRVSYGHITVREAEDQVLISVTLAMGVGLFGHAMADLVGSPATRTRDIALDMLRSYHATTSKS